MLKRLKKLLRCSDPWFKDQRQHCIRASALRVRADCTRHGFTELHGLLERAAEHSHLVSSGVSVATLLSFCFFSAATLLSFCFFMRLPEARRLFARP